MPVETSDVLIVGAGIAGTTLALELAAGGLSVTMLERAHVGAGSSSLNAGGIRQQFSQEINIRVAANTVSRLKAFPEQYGEGIAYRQMGYLFVFTTTEDEERLARAIALQNMWDVPTRFVPTEDVAELVPGAGLDGVLGGAFGPTDGYVDPRATVTAFGRAALRSGVRIELGEATALLTRGDHVDAVVVGDRRFSAGVIVNAAGAWAPNVARLYGGDLPIAPRRAEIFVLDHALVAGRLTPMVLDYSLGMAFHTEGRGLLVSAGATTLLPEAPLTVSPDPQTFPGLKLRLAERLPETAAYGLAQSWAGLIEVTPDSNPIVGWTHMDNVFTVAGFSGHGMCLAPGLAPDAARLLRGERPHLPIHAYSLDRFESDGVLEPEVMWGGGRTSELLSPRQGTQAG